MPNEYKAELEGKTSTFEDMVVDETGIARAQEALEKAIEKEKNEKIRFENESLAIKKEWEEKEAQRKEEAQVRQTANEKEEAADKLISDARDAETAKYKGGLADARLKEKEDMRASAEKLGFADIINKNSAFVMGIGIIPAAIASTTLQNSVAISILYAITIIITFAFASLLAEAGFMRAVSVRIPVYVLISALAIVPGLMLAKLLYPTTLEDMLGYYLFVAVFDALIIFEADKKARGNKLGTALKNALILIAGIFLVAVVIGSIREFLTRGSIYGFSIIKNLNVKAAAYPLFGFILLGGIAALFQGIKHRIDNPVVKEKQKANMKHKTKEQEISMLKDEQDQNKDGALPLIYEEKDKKAIKKANQLKPLLKQKEVIGETVEFKALEEISPESSVKVELSGETEGGGLLPSLETPAASIAPSALMAEEDIAQQKAEKEAEKPVPTPVLTTSEVITGADVKEVIVADVTEISAIIETSPETESRIVTATGEAAALLDGEALVIEKREAEVLEEKKKEKNLEELEILIKPKKKGFTFKIENVGKIDEDNNEDND